MTFVYVKFNRQRNVTNNAYTQVSTFADLPSASLYANKTFIVLTTTGIPFFTRKLSGMYYSDGANWNFLSAPPSMFSSGDFQIYQNDTIYLKFVISALSTIRNIIMPDRDITLDKITNGITDTDLVNNTILKSNGTKIVPAISGTDYEPAFSKNTGFNQNFETVATEIKMNGTQAIGVSANIPRADHVHPSDTTRVDKVSGESIGGIKRFTASSNTFNNSTGFGTGVSGFIPPQSSIQLYQNGSYATQSNQFAGANNAVITSSWYLVFLNPTAPVTYQVSSGDAIFGRRKFLKNISAFTITLTVEFSAYTIDGNASYTLLAGQSVEIIYDANTTPTLWRTI